MRSPRGCALVGVCCTRRAASTHSPLSTRFLWVVTFVKFFTRCPSGAPDLALLVGRHIRLRHVVQVDHVRKVAALHTAHEHARIGLPLSVDPLDNVGRIREVIVPVGR